jgi:hypothetical protein
MAEIAILIGFVATSSGYGIKKKMKKIKKKKEEKRRLKEKEERKQKLIKKYIKRTKEVKEISKKSKEICVICQEDYKEDSECSKLYCGHKYHKHCISEWITHKKTCPLCNTRLQKRKKNKKTEEEIILLELKELVNKSILGAEGLRNEIRRIKLLIRLSELQELKE